MKLRTRGAEAESPAGEAPGLITAANKLPHDLPGLIAETNTLRRLAEASAIRTTGACTHGVRRRAPIHQHRPAILLPPFIGGVT